MSDEDEAVSAEDDLFYDGGDMFLPEFGTGLIGESLRYACEYDSGKCYQTPILNILFTPNEHCLLTGVDNEFAVFNANFRTVRVRGDVDFWKCICSKLSTRWYNICLFDLYNDIWE
jgi:hypothetical protein